MNQPLIDAVKAGNASEVARLLDGDRSLVGATGDNGTSAILLALYYRHPELAPLFIDRGAALDIFEASALGRVDRIKALLADDPARVSAYAEDGFYPVGLAAFFGQLAAVEVLIDAGADLQAPARNPFKVQSIHAAAASGNIEIVRAVLEGGADANAQQQAGFRAMHEAGSKGDRALAELLVGFGANPRLKNDEGKSSIDFANEKGHKELAKWMEMVTIRQ
jgi:ankyrin repeat protein